MKKVSILIITIFLVVFLLGFALLNFNKEEKINILLYGVDGRSDIDEIERSDAIILVNYNFSKRRIVATSIPRDSYVKITCKNNSYDKINHAYAYGKEKCLNETVEQLFEISGVKNIMLNFNDVVKIVDFFGLIEVNPKYTFCQSNESLKIKYCFEKGKKILIDGQQALAYMRSRKNLPNGDISRAENQRQILKIVIERFLNLSFVEKIEFYNYIKDNLKTNLELNDFNIKKLINVKQIDLNEYTLRGEDYINKYYYYKLDGSYLEKIKKYYI